MSIIKEFREFFLRATVVNTGSKQDKEQNFPVDYIIDGKQVKNRFLIDHYPSENVFKKLFESLTFKLNIEDTASETSQGLVKQASTTQFDNGVDTDIIDNFTLVPKPSQVQTINSKIGNQQYLENNFVTDGETITNSIEALDQQVSGNETNIVNLTAMLIPTGGIIIWSGLPSAIPTGWLLCDGTIGTPDLQGKFVVGYKATPNPNDYSTIGNTGGEENHTLLSSEAPAHKHKIDVSLGNPTPGVLTELSPSAVVTNSDGVNSTFIETNTSNGASPHENRPPYYVIAYIMKS